MILKYVFIFDDLYILLNLTVGKQVYFHHLTVNKTLKQVQGDKTRIQNNKR